MAVEEYYDNVGKEKWRFLVNRPLLCRCGLHNWLHTRSPYFKLGETRECLRCGRIDTIGDNNKWVIDWDRQYRNECNPCSSCACWYNGEGGSSCLNCYEWNHWTLTDPDDGPQTPER